MKFLIALALVIFVASKYAEGDGSATLLSPDSDTAFEYWNKDGYDYKFKSSDNIEKQEILDTKEPGVVSGFYEYTDPDGRLVRVDYTAGAGIGFKPRSSPDVIPQEIIEAIDKNLQNPPEATK